ncbi:FabA/FabZ family ACP-dehydratase [Streptosporangium sp. NPDC000396]|uniref:FabA/FabZ family ACP-dehydratase n=1 Tax=Streptosporangium sp. NPDC000396 TaxID=3366185 RepID=UPI0036BB4566
MTRTVEAGWTTVPGVPSVAAPLRAVDLWRSERAGDKLTMTVRVGVRGDDPNLRGHFPGLAVFPGVFVIETLCQAMAFAVPPGTAVSPAPPVLRSVRSVRFLAPLLDGDELTLRIVASPRPEGGWAVTAEGSRRDGTTTARIRADFDPGEAAHA